MAVISSSSFPGVPVNRARVESTVRASVMRAIAEGQAYTWETITGDPVGASLVATPHTHDGVTGAVIPIPLGVHYLDAQLYRPTPSAPGTPGYAPILLVPYYAAKGVTRVRVVGMSRLPTDLEGLRVRTYIPIGASGYLSVYSSSTSAVPHTPASPLYAGSPTLSTFTWSVDVDTPQAGTGDPGWFALEVAAWDGSAWPEQENAAGPGPAEIRYYDSIAVLPLATTQTPVTALGPDLRGATLSPHLPIEESFLDDDRSLNAFVLDRMRLNDDRSYAALMAHTHGAQSTHRGPIVPAQLFSHSLGVMRRGHYTQAHTGQIVADEAISTAEWRGRIQSPCLAPTNTDYQIVARAAFQLPAGGGIFSEREAAVLVYGVAESEVEARVLNQSFASGGTAVDKAVDPADFPSQLRRLVVLTGIEASTDATDEEDEQTIVIRMRRVGSPVSNRSIGIYGYALAITGAS